MQTTTDMTVATTILEQLGGRKFIAMTGAKNFVGGKDYLAFALPSRFAKDGINNVKITLTYRDDYTVEFNKLWGVNLKSIAVVDGVYCDMLRDIFTDYTGLDTSL
jgi:hypothetical protein